MKKILSVVLLSTFLAGGALANNNILAFDSMYAVDGPFVNSSAIRGVKGLVFPNRSPVPRNLRGINDEKKFRGLVSCLIESHGHMMRKNIITNGFPASRSGNSHIDAHLKLPEECVAPVVFIMSGPENKWFAVTGNEEDI